MEFGGLKVLMISTDRNILTLGSAVSERMKEYGKLVEELHIVLLSDSVHALMDTQLDKNVWVYPTNSSSKWFRSRSAARIGKKIVLDKKFVRGKSVITAQDPFECGLAGLKIKNKWRLPLEVQLHTDPFSPYFTGLLNWIRKYIARKVLRRADTLRVVTVSLGDEITKRFSVPQSKISVLPIYVDQKTIEEGKISFDLHSRFGWHFVILVLARLTEEKNVALALEVLAKLRTQFVDTGLVIVGAGTEEGKLKALAKSLDVETNVAFVGWQENTASYYRTANLFLQTSFFEGYGMALVEAGLSGLPVVSTPVGLASELVDGKDAYICPPNADYMANAIADLIENNAKREMFRLSLKRTLESKLISKEEYLKRLKQGWEKTAGEVHA
jgi:glycosyltransferase involved in cell wall biosynthesis